MFSFVSMCVSNFLFTLGLLPTKNEVFKGLSFKPMDFLVVHCYDHVVNIMCNIRYSVL